jgi:hypothetical protein
VVDVLDMPGLKYIIHLFIIILLRFALTFNWNVSQNVVLIFIFIVNKSSGILRRVIIEQIGAFLVLPNKLSFTLSDVVSPIVVKIPEPSVSISLVGAIKL